MQTKKRQRLIEEGVWEFNEKMGGMGRGVRLVWNKHMVGVDSYLTLEEVLEGENAGGMRRGRSVREEDGDGGGDDDGFGGLFGGNGKRKIS